MATIYFDYLDRGSKTVSDGNDLLVDGAPKQVTGAVGTAASDAVGDSKAAFVANDFTAADLAAGNLLVAAETDAGCIITHASLSVSAAQGVTAASADLVVLHKDGTTTTLAAGLNTLVTTGAVASDADGLGGYTTVEGDKLCVNIAAADAPADATVTLGYTFERRS